MYESGDLRKGLKIEIDGEPYILVKFAFVKPGKGQALYKCTLKNMITGTQGYCFMNTSNYEQEFLVEDQIAESKNFLKENTVCNVLLFDEKPIGISLPNFINLRIKKADPWVKGDTASGDTKPATLETGYSIQVPTFIEEGELVKIDTRTGEYVERVKE